MRIDRELTRSFPARLVATCFIALILLGNCWFVLTIVGYGIPPWFRVASSLAISGGIGGGLWLAGLALRNRASDNGIRPHQ